MKQCADCGESKAFDEFPKSAQNKDGRHRYCNVCNRARVKRWKKENAERVKSYEAENRRAISDRERRNRMMRNYGLTEEQYQVMVDSQGGLCAGCEEEPSGRWLHLAIDHDHATGEVRGLLCDSCNKVLGFAKDKPGVLRRLADYLEATREHRAA